MLKSSASKAQSQQAKKSGMSPWKGIALCMIIVILPWALYVNFHPRGTNTDHAVDVAHPANSLGQIEQKSKTPKVLDVSQLESVKPVVKPANALSFPDLPVLGPVPTNGAVPLWDVKHKGTDAIFALACNYPTIYYKRFVGSLRKFGYTEDIVLAVSPVPKMKPGVEAYLKETNVVAYGFDVDCEGTDNCKLRDEFLGYPDPRPHRTFANIRYALYEYWLRQYSDRSYILILDFRDTFFQANPFAQYGNFADRSVRYDLQMYAENYKVGGLAVFSLPSFLSCGPLTWLRCFLSFLCSLFPTGWWRLLESAV